MQKLDMQSFKSLENNIEIIAELFPQVITEKEDENGNTVKAIDFDLFKALFSSELAEWSEERYRLDWPWKKASILKANTPINKTLRPIKEDSVDFDNTQNLYIEWDNFEVLKILQESYLWQVKMIYIDPPYNTGKDFVYKDNFKVSKDEYEEELGATDEEWWRLFKNTDTNGRFHSDWLSMMYERLVVARDLLKDDWVIFMSIDDNEVHNLRKIADEIFGEENFVAQLVWQNKEWWGWSDSNHFRIKHEYCLCFSKNIININIKWVEITNEDRYKDFDEYVNTRWKYYLQKLWMWSLGYIKSLDFSIVWPWWVDIYPNSDWKKVNRWRWWKDKVEWGLKNWFIEFKKDSNWEWHVYTKQYINCDNEWNIINRTNRPLWVIDNFSSTQANKKLLELLGKKLFDYPKPTDYISYLLDRVTNNNDIILDFFSWSATTAHAVMQLNAEDGWNRKFIMVQIPEETLEDSEAYKAWYKNICEIWKERIRRAGKKIIEENKDKLAERETPLDTWFRVYRVDSTNMKDVYYHPAQITQDKLFELESNIKEDRTGLDILTWVILDLWLTLDLPIEEKTIAWNKVYFVAGNSLVACFDENINFDIVDEIAKLEPLKVVFRDSSFRDDKDRINFETRFKKLSPESDLRVL